MIVPCRDGEVEINGESVGVVDPGGLFEPSPGLVLAVEDLLRLHGNPHRLAYTPVIVVHPSQWSLIKAACTKRPGEYAVSLYGCEVYRSRHLPPPGGARRKRARVRRVA